MGNSSSKPVRKLGKELPKVVEGVAKAKVTKKLTEDYLDVKKAEEAAKKVSSATKASNGNPSEEPPTGSNPKIYTTRPNEVLEEDDSFFRKAVEMGVLNVKETEGRAGQQFDSNHSSLRLVKNRETVEKQYEDLMTGTQVSYDIPARFLTKEQKENMKKPRKKASNTFGLVDSTDLTKLIEVYQKEGAGKLAELAEEKGTDKVHIDVIQQALESGLLTLPSFKVVMAQKKNAEGQVEKEKLIVVPADMEEPTAQSKHHVKHGKKKQPPAPPKKTAKKIYADDAVGDEAPDDELLNEFHKLEDLIRDDDQVQADRQASEAVSKKRHHKTQSELKRYL